MSNSGLQPQAISTFSTQLTDKGSKAMTDISFWRPTSLSTDYYYVGFYATSNYVTPPVGFLNTYKQVGTPELPCLAAPTGFTAVWVCDGDNNCNLGIFAPIAPDGYLAIGCIAVVDYHFPPTVSDYPDLMCVRQDLCTQVTLTLEENLIYADHGDNCNDDVTVFKLPNSQATYAVAGYPTTVPAWDVEALKL